MNEIDSFQCEFEKLRQKIYEVRCIIGTYGADPQATNVYERLKERWIKKFTSFIGNYVIDMDQFVKYWYPNSLNDNRRYTPRYENRNFYTDSHRNLSNYWNQNWSRDQIRPSRRFPIRRSKSNSRSPTNSKARSGSHFRKISKSRSKSPIDLKTRSRSHFRNISKSRSRSRTNSNTRYKSHLRDISKSRSRSRFRDPLRYETSPRSRQEYNFNFVCTYGHTEPLSKEYISTNNHELKRKRNSSSYSPKSKVPNANVSSSSAYSMVSDTSLASDTSFSSNKSTKVTSSTKSLASLEKKSTLLGEINSNHFCSSVSKPKIKTHKANSHSYKAEKMDLKNKILSNIKEQVKSNKEIKPYKSPSRTNESQINTNKTPAKQISPEQTNNEITNEVTKKTPIKFSLKSSKQCQETPITSTNSINPNSATSSTNSNNESVETNSNKNESIRKVEMKETSTVKSEPDIIIEAVVHKKDEARSKLAAILAKFKKPKEENVEIIPKNEIVNIPSSSSQISQEQISNGNKATYKYENTDFSSMSNQAIASIKKDEIKTNGNGIKNLLEAPTALFKGATTEPIFFSIEDFDTNYSDPDELQNQFDNSDYEYGDD